jgi:hypothetical protein
MLMKPAQTDWENLLKQPSFTSYNQVDWLDMEFLTNYCYCRSINCFLIVDNVNRSLVKVLS